MDVLNPLVVFLISLAMLAVAFDLMVIEPCETLKQRVRAVMATVAAALLNVMAMDVLFF